MQDLIDRGEASPETEYATLYRALAHALCADEGEGDFAIHRLVVTLEAGDRLLLCSDGVHDEIGEEGLRALFDPNADVITQVTRWCDAVWHRGAKDNLSIILIGF